MCCRKRPKLSSTLLKAGIETPGQILNLVRLFYDQIVSDLISQVYFYGIVFESLP